MDQSSSAVDVSMHTRALTLVACMKRLLHADCKSAMAQRKLSPDALSELTIHLVGADHREGNAGMETCAIFQLFFQYLCHEESVAKLNFVLVGPNIARQLHRTSYIRSIAEQTSSGDALNVDMQYFVGSFDEYHQDKELYLAPDLAVCFNAGIWGYDQWLPTLHLLVHTLAVPLLITSYNANEATDDEDIVDDEIAPSHWFWRAEKNPFGSLRHRYTTNEFGSILRENDYWMCVGPSV